MATQQDKPVPFQQHLLQFKLSAEQLENLGNKIIENHKALEDKVSSLPTEKWTRETLLELLDGIMEFQTQYASCYFPIYVSNDKELKSKATEVKNKISEYSVESSQREDMYLAMKNFQEKFSADPNKLGLTEEEQRWVSFEIRDYIRNGLSLPIEQRKKLAEVQKRISEKETQFNRNLNDDNTKKAFTKEELKGMSDDFLNSLEKEEETGKYLVTLKYPDVGPLMQKCQVESTRKAMDLLNGNKGGPDNVKLFEEVIELRKQVVDLLGYETYSDYVLELRMAKTKNNVLNFLTDLRSKLKPFAETELKTLVNLKEKHCKENGLEFDGKINSWDFAFYNNLLLDTEYQLDDDKIKEYFPIEKVTQGMFDIYQTILGLRFEKLTDFQTWHPDVTCTAVYDAKTNNYMGQFYLDMYPREGKYGHACVIGMQRAGNKSDGTRQYPCCVMLCNFTKPTQDKPSLLRHSEVETFFHEFGHVMHNICTEATVNPFSCTLVERDFVEAPSQMLENWTYEQEPLEKMSGHYKDLSKPLPKEYIDSLVRAKNVNTGLLNLRQIFFGTFDMKFHTTKEKLDSGEVWRELRKEVTLIEQQPGTNPASGFAHLMGGYQSGYYGYLWSQVYSADMYEGGFKGKVLDPTYGMKYRKLILAPGKSRDSIESLKQFLGREPQQEPFLRGIGVLEAKPSL